MALRKTSADYFSHDADASEDEKIMYLESLFGLAGYALYFKLVERLCRSSNFEMKFGPVQRQVLAKHFGVSLEQFEEFIVAATCSDVAAFRCEDGLLWSDGLKKRMAYLVEKRIRDAERIAQKRAESAQKKHNSLISEDVAATSAQVKESKVKESKVKNINSNTAAAENAFSGDETDEDFKKIGSIGEAAPVIDMQSRLESMLQDAHDSPANFEAFVRGRKIPREKYEEYWPAFELEARVKKDKLHSQTDVSTYWLNFSSFRYEKEQRAAAGNGQKAGIKSFQNGRASLSEKQVF